jgi:hypothetical protein
MDHIKSTKIKIHDLHICIQTDHNFLKTWSFMITKVSVSYYVCQETDRYSQKEELRVLQLQLFVVI